MSVRMKHAGEMIGAVALGNAHALARVTFGVTWGKQGHASASSSSPKLPEAKPVTSSAGSRVTCEPNGRRGNFVEIISSPARRIAPKSLKKMVVEAVTCEPVSASTTGINRAISRISPFFAIP